MIEISRYRLMKKRKKYLSGISSFSIHLNLKNIIRLEKRNWKKRFVKEPHIPLNYIKKYRVIIDFALNLK